MCSSDLLAPTLDGQGGNAQKFGDFGDGEKVGEISEAEFFLGDFGSVVHI